MTERHAENRWPTDPRRMTHPQIIRHLQACGPCAESLHQTTRSPHPGAHVARRERSGPAMIDNILARALSEGDGQAAVLLYEMARASIKQIEPYASEIEWTEEPAPFMDLRADVCTLSKRLKDGGGRLKGLPAATPAVAASADTADGCLDLAERFAPGWQWVEFERTQVAVVRGDFEAATAMLGRIGPSHEDQLLRCWVMRNDAYIAMCAHDWKRALRAADALEAERGDELASMVVRVEAHIGLGSKSQSEESIAALTRAVSTWTASESRSWAAFLMTRVEAHSADVSHQHLDLTSLRAMLEGQEA